MLAVLSVLLCIPARAEVPEDAFGAAAVEEAMPRSAREALGEVSAAEPDPEGALQRLAAYAGAQLKDVLTEVLRPLASIALLCILAGIGESFDVGGKTGTDAVALGSCLAIALIGAEDVRSVLALGTETLAELSGFSAALLPTLTTAAAASGAVGAAGAAYTASALFSDLLLTAAEKLILPVICFFVAMTAAGAVLGEPRLEGVTKLLRRLASGLMKGLVLAFTAYLSLTGILASAADAAAVKTAKAVLSAALPVVGKLMADASEALVAGANLLRGAVGVFGMLVCLAAMVLPVLRLGLRCVLFRAATVLCSGFAGQRQSKLISGLADAYGLLLGLVGSAAIMEYLAIISLVRTVTA